MKLLIALVALALPAAALARQAPPAQGSGKSGNTVSGVTVEGRKPAPKTCAPRDKDCIALVVAELKARYPKELQKWCDTVSERAATANIAIDELNGAIATPNTRSESGQFYAPAVTKVACAPDGKRK